MLQLKVVNNAFLKPAPNLVEFFTRRVREALAQQGLSVSEEVEFYVVQLLAHFADADKLFTVSPEDGKKELRPLALKLHDATFSTPDKRYVHLKNLGDTALYQAGVFYDGIYAGAVSVDYYISMGGQAYFTLANLSTSYQRVVADMFAELSEHFAQLVEILKLSCEAEIAATDHDLLKLLERYQKTKSLKAKKMLSDLGIDPDAVFQTLKSMQ